MIPEYSKNTNGPYWRVVGSHEFWTVVVMLSLNSIFAHEVFSGTFEEVNDFLSTITIKGY